MCNTLHFEPAIGLSLRGRLQRFSCTVDHPLECLVVDVLESLQPLAIASNMHLDRPLLLLSEIDDVLWPVRLMRSCIKSILREVGRDIGKGLLRICTTVTALAIPTVVSAVIATPTPVTPR